MEVVGGGGRVLDAAIVLMGVVMVEAVAADQVGGGG
jgi:hypothetical protein